MQKTNVTALNHAVEEAHDWLRDLQARGPFANEQQAYSHLRAVLHAVRDRLTVEEAVHFAAGMPMIVRGFYYEGWRPALAPNTDRKTEDDFLNAVKESLRADDAPVSEFREAAMSVLSLLTDRIAEGQIRHARDQLPAEMRTIWPA